MQTLNIVSSLNSQNGAAKTIKSNPVVNADNSFNKLLKKEINGNKTASAPSSSEANGKLSAKNVEPAKQDSATPPEELNGTGTANETATIAAPKKSEDAEKEDNTTEKKDTDDSDHQLIQLFNALNDISKLAPPKSGTDVAVKSEDNAIKTVSLKPDTDAAIKSEVDAINAVSIKSGADVAVKSKDNAIKTVSLKSDADVSIKSEAAIGTDATTNGLSLQPLNGKKVSPSVETSKDAAFDVIVNNAMSARLETSISTLTSKASVASETPVTDASLDVKGKETGSDIPTAFADHLDAKTEKGDSLKLQTGAQQDALPKAIVSGDKLERSVDKLAFNIQKDEAVNPVSAQQNQPQQQLNATQNATITGAVTTNQIAPPLNSSAWDKAVGQKVIWMVGESMQSAQLTLNPPDLGPLQIVLNVTNDQANATFISAHPDVREALEASLPKLRQMMDDAGVQLSGFSVSAEASNQGQQGREFRQSNPTSSIAALGANDSLISNQTISEVKTSKIISRIGAVDTFA